MCSVWCVMCGVWYVVCGMCLLVCMSSQRALCIPLTFLRPSERICMTYCWYAFCSMCATYGGGLYRSRLAIDVRLWR